MALETELKTFTLEDSNGEEHKYEFNLLPASKGIVQGKYWVGVMGAIKDAGLIMEAIDSVSTDAEFSQRYPILFDKVLRDGEPVKLDKHYTGNLGELMMAIMYIAKENFEVLWSGKLEENLAKVLKQ